MYICRKQESFALSALALLVGPQGHHLSSKLKTLKIPNRKMAATEIYK